MIESGCSSTGVLILSTRDNPALNSLEEVIADLPESIRVLAVDDIEHLLPISERNRTNVLAMLSRLHAFVADRNICARVTSGVALADEIRPGERHE